MLALDNIPSRFVTVPLSVGLGWRGGGGWRYEEKKDGVRCVLDGAVLHGRSTTYRLPGAVPADLNGCRLDGELVRGVYWVFDVPVIHGQDIRQRPLHERIAGLVELSQSFPPWMHLIPTGSGGEYLEAVLRDGGEGVIAKRLSAPYAFGWVRCKRHETHDVAVTAIHPSRQSIELGERGWCPVQSPSVFDCISVGAVVEIGCHSITARGKFRGPRLLRIRDDKA